MSGKILKAGIGIFMEDEGIRRNFETHIFLKKMPTDSDMEEIQELVKICAEQIVDAIEILPLPKPPEKK